MNTGTSWAASSSQGDGPASICVLFARATNSFEASFSSFLTSFAFLFNLASISASALSASC